MVLLLSTVSSFRMPSNFRRNFHCIITNYFLRKLIGIICFLLEGMDKLGLLTIQRRCCPDWSMVTNNHLYELKIREIKYFNQKKQKKFYYVCSNFQREFGFFPFSLVILCFFYVIPWHYSFWVIKWLSPAHIKMINMSPGPWSYDHSNHTATKGGQLLISY